MREKEEYIQFIRRFKLSSILNACGEMSKYIFNNPSFSKGIAEKDVGILKRNGGFEKFTVQIFQWELLKLAFDAIKHCNEHRNKEMQETDLLFALDKLKKYENEEQGKVISKENAMDFMNVLVNEQAYFQEYRIDQEYSRIYKMFHDINKNPKYIQNNTVSYIDLSEEFKRIVGYDIIDYYALSMIVYAAVYNQSNVEINNKLKVDLSSEITLEKILKFLEDNSVTIKQLKEEETYSLLKLYPIVNFGDRRFFVVNVFAYLKNIPGRIYWNIRDKFKDKNQKFTNYFGYCFECYVEEILHTYLSKKSFSKIDEAGVGKKADWKIETNKYLLIIEQKSTLFRRNASDTTPTFVNEAIDAVDYFTKKTVGEAFEQLRSTNVDTVKEVIRIFVSYEKIYMEEPYVDKAKQELKIPQEEQYWIVNIEDFENLIATLGNDEEKFNEVVKKKIILEKTKDKNGRSLSKINDSEYLGDYFRKIDVFDKHIREGLKIDI